MDNNKITASELAKYYEIQIFEVLQLQKILGFGMASILLYKLIRNGVTKI